MMTDTAVAQHKLSNSKSELALHEPQQNPPTNPNDNAKELVDFVHVGKINILSQHGTTAYVVDIMTFG